MQNGRIIAVVIIIVCVAFFIMLAVGFALNNSAPPSPSPAPTLTPAIAIALAPAPAPAPASLAPAPAPASNCVPGKCSMEAGKRYVGAASENINGPGAIKTTLSDCETKCNANPQCKQYVYFQPNQFCYLETQVHPDAPVVDSRFTSGYCHNC